MKGVDSDAGARCPQAHGRTAEVAKQRPLPSNRFYDNMLVNDETYLTFS
jgi:hypothetical protein